ncbi:MAG TPA: hypothetical protein VGM88_12310 [Kofleriaceae bacterium]|jgi:hypothetical protein
MSTDNITLRVPTELKREIEAGAERENRNVTDFLLRAARARLAPQCPTCGRSDQPGFVSPGMSPAMDAFLAAHKERGDNSPVTITVENYVYWTRLRNDVPHNGMLNVWVRLGQWYGEDFHEERVMPLPIPRGYVSGWEYDLTGSVYRTLATFGYVDGNEQIINALRFQVQQLVPRQPPQVAVSTPARRRPR